VERQLKERLIGASVLIAIIVILVPEIFSGSRPRPDGSSTQDEVNPSQLKTYQIDLQSASENTPPSEPEQQAAQTVEPPAPEPRLPIQDEPPQQSLPSAVVAAGSVGSAAAVSATRAASSTTSRQQASSASQSAASHLPVASAGGRWAVQIGSFGAQARADQIAAKLKSMGYAASVTPIKASGKTLYRVRTGSLAERAAADIMLKKIKMSFPDASVVPSS
jgi:DedD protein